MGIQRLAGRRNRSLLLSNGLKLVCSLGCDKGLPQFVQLDFESPVIPERVSWVFQGGFVGTACSVQVPLSVESTKEWRLWTKIYPEDVNRRQTFNLRSVEPDDTARGLKAIRFVFEESSDFFGRVTVYDLKLEGSVVQTF